MSTAFRTLRPAAVVAIDFGTAGVGYCIAQPAAPGAAASTARVFPFKPGDRGADATEKSLTAVLIEDETGNVVAIGKEARRRFYDLEPADMRRHQYVEQFKMCMAPSRRGTRPLHERTVVALGVNRAIPLLSAVAKVLETIKVEALDRLRAMGGVVPDRVCWVLTVPAIWDDAAKALMRAAAAAAGIVPDAASPRLQLALEPEGALIACALEAAPETAARLAVGTAVLVLDCGGGTVDANLSQIVCTAPYQLRELAPSSGDAWGGTGVDAQFRRFANDLLTAPMAGGGGGGRADPAVLTACVEAWEAAKCGWDPDDPMRAAVVVGGLAAVAEAAGGVAALQARIAAYNEAHGLAPPHALAYRRASFSLALPPAIVAGFYDHCVRPICAHVRALLSGARRDGHAVRFVFLVGGFAESVYLQRAVQRALDEDAAEAAAAAAAGGGDGACATLIVPHKPVQAVNRGAALWGLHPHAFVVSRKARATYLVKLAEPYDAALHEPLPHPAYKLTAPGSGLAYAAHVAVPLVRRGADVPVDHVVRQAAMPLADDQSTCTVQLYRTDVDVPDASGRSRREFVWDAEALARLEAEGGGGTDGKVTSADLVATVVVNVGGPEAGPRAQREVMVEVSFGRTEITAHATGTATGESKQVTLTWER